MGREIIVWFLLLIILLGQLVSDTAVEHVGPALIFFLSYTLALSMREHRERSRQEFVNQLKSQRRELRAGGTVVINNLLVRYDTELLTFHVNVGGLLSSVVIPSPYCMADSENHPQGVLYSMLSLVTGWWAPTGPIMTVLHIHKNLLGGERTRVAYLADGILFKRREKARELAMLRDQAIVNKVAAPQEAAVATTGSGSRSAAELEIRTRIPSGKSLAARLDDWYSPVPSGQRQLNLVKQTLLEHLSDLGIKIKSATLLHGALVRAVPGRLRSSLGSSRDVTDISKALPVTRHDSGRKAFGSPGSSEVSNHERDCRPRDRKRLK